MKHTDMEIFGRVWPLSFTAEALFTVYDKFGVTDDILKTTHALEPTAEGWRNCCWLCALLAAQGELQRRRRGESPLPLLPVEELRCGVMAAESTLVRVAVRAALEQGFRRDIPDDEPEEVNLVLLEREEAEKKARARGRSALAGWLQQLRGSI